MGLLRAALRADVDGFADSYYATDRPMWSIAGVNVGYDAAMRISTVFACVRILAETVGSLPCIVYRRRPDDGKERAAEHPLYDILHDSPNDDQDAVEWFEMMTGWAALRGSGLSEIVGGQRGFVDQLVGLHPSVTKAEKVYVRGKRVVRYRVQETDGTRYLAPDEVFKLRGFSDTGLQGYAIGDLARDSFGVALAAERHAARSFSSAPRPAGTLELPAGQRLSDPAFDRLQKELAAHAGSGGQRALILEDGAKYNSIGMTNKDAEFLATRQFSVPEICRWFRIPPHMVADLQAGASYASIEMMSLEFVIFTMLPWFRRWEQAISRDLIVARQTYFAEFMLNGLLRGDAKSRNESYAVARQWGWLSVNDIRRLENLNPVPGGDAYLTPLNMTNSGAPSAWAVLDEEGKVLHLDPESSGGKLVGLLASDAASRVVRKEIAAMRKLGKGDAWESGVRAFYAEHAAYVAREVHIPIEEADAWAQSQRDTLLADGPDALDRWEAGRADDLSAVALREAAGPVSVPTVAAPPDPAIRLLEAIASRPDPAPVIVPAAEPREPIVVNLTNALPPVAIRLTFDADGMVTGEEPVPVATA